MKKKLRDERGETLVEILAAILICTLSVTLLFGSVMASANMDLQTQDMDQRYYEALSKAEQQAGGDNYGTVTVKGEVGERYLTVTFYGSEQLLSYAFTEGAGP